MEEIQNTSNRKLKIAFFTLLTVFALLGVGCFFVVHRTLSHIYADKVDIVSAPAEGPAPLSPPLPTADPFAEAVRTDIDYYETGEGHSTYHGVEISTARTAHLEALAVHVAGPCEGDIVLIHRQQQGGPACYRVPHIIPRVGGAQQARSRADVEIYPGFEVERAAEEVSSREDEAAASLCGDEIYCGLKGGGVEGGAVCLGAEIRCQKVLCG